MMKTLLIFAIVMLSATLAFAQKTKNIILISIDNALLRKLAGLIYLTSKQV